MMHLALVLALSLTDAARNDSAWVDTPTGRLAGSLLVPSGGGPFPLVVIIAGSGPTDRDGNSKLLPGANNSLRYLAEGLAARGIASLRYDKRGVGESAKALLSEGSMRFDMGADDAAEWVKKLRADRRFTTITIIGHSEGSLLGMLTAQRAPVDGYVSIAGTGFPAADILKQQLAKQLPPPLLENANASIDTLLAGHTVSSPPPELMSLFRPSVQPYLISWFKVDPRAEIARLAIPTLVIQGTRDMQVTEADAHSLAKAQPKAKLVIIDGMNHVLKQVGEDPTLQRSSYSDPSLPDSPQLIDTVADFVKGVRGRRVPP